MCPLRPSQSANQPNQPTVHNAPDSSFYVLTPLGSSINYVLSNSNCSPLIDVSVTINVTQDMVYASGTGSPGFDFQLNAYSPITQKAVGWQQYVISFDGTKFTGWVNNWTPTPNSVAFINTINNAEFAWFQSPKIPAGFLISITLTNDAAGNVIGVTYIVVDNLGNQLGNKPISLTTLPLLVKPYKLVTQAYLAPVVAFELDIVGVDSQAHAVLSSGAGTITCSASSALTASNQVPACAASSSIITGESANTVYGVLFPPSPSNTFSQSFNVSNDDAAPPPSQPQLTVNVTPNETGYDVSWTGEGFPAGHSVEWYLVGLTGRTAPLSIGESPAGANGNIGGDYTYICTSSDVPPSPNVTLQAQIGTTVFASSTSFAFSCS